MLPELFDNRNLPGLRFKLAGMRCCGIPIEQGVMIVRSPVIYRVSTKMSGDDAGHLTETFNTNL